MKTPNFLAIAILLIVLTNSVNLYGQVFDTVHVSSPGMLSVLLTAGEMNTITNLKLTGTINEEDFEVMRSEMPELKYIDLKDVSTIGDSIPRIAFSDNKRLSGISLPESITCIGLLSFTNCDSLEAINIPESVKKIGFGAFQLCRSIDSLIIPNSVKEIGNNAFFGMHSLKKIDLSDSITVLGDLVLGNCFGLTSIEIPASVKTVGNSVFVTDTNLVSINLPLTLESIGDFSFAGCYKVDQITIPAQLTKIGMGAFMACSGVKQFIVDDANPNYASMDGTLTDKNKAVIYQYPPARPDSKYIIPSTIEHVNNYAFYYSWNLKSLYIPSSVTSIGNFAFILCDSLLRIKVYNPEPIVLTDDVFSLFNTNKCSLYVPSGSKAAYETAYPWNTFVNIIEFPLLLNVSSDEIILPDIGGSAAFEINSTVIWRIINDNSWLEISPTAGADSASITITADANLNSVGRGANLWIYSEDGIFSTYLTVLQAPVAPLGIKEASEDIFYVYPLPVIDLLHVDGAAGTTVQILNLHGSVVISKYIADKSDIIDMSDLMPGVYLLRSTGRKGSLKITKY